MMRRAAYVLLLTQAPVAMYVLAALLDPSMGRPEANDHPSVRASYGDPAVAPWF